VELKIKHLSADTLGLSEVAKAALSDRPHPAALPGLLVPAKLEHIPQLDDSYDEEDRAALCADLDAGLAPFSPHVAVRDNLTRLAEPKVSLVIAGQQPAFLGGPLYNIYKIAHAIRLAQALTEKWGTPVLPAFWNHADDHDIAEVHHLWIQTPSLELRKVGLAGESSGRAPLSRLHFNEEKHALNATREILRQGLPNYNGREAAIERFMPRSGESFSNAFTRIMLELFGSRGLIVIEPDWIRTPLSRALAHVVHADCYDSLAAGATELRQHGGQPVIDEASAALAFHHIDGKRHALRHAPDGFRYDGEKGSRTPSELAAEIVQAPADYSAGALLRPLVQDMALPSVAYVGGWGELAYHAQIPKLRHAAGVRQTAFVPRLSATLVNNAMAKSLGKLGLDAAHAIQARGQVELAEEPSAGSPLALELRAIAQDTKSAILAQKAKLTESERNMGQQFKKTASQVQATLQKLADKVERIHANANGSSKRHARRIQNGLYPRNTPQERIQGPLEVCSEAGYEWIEQLIREIDPLPTEHLLLYLLEDDAPHEA